MLASSLRHIAQVRATTPRVYWILWWGMLINRMGGFVVPLLTLYLTGDRGLSIGEAAAVVSMFGLGQMVSSVIGGALADKIGRRITMLIGLFGGAAMMATLAFATTVPQMTVLVGLLGLVGELYRPAVLALVSDVVAPEHRAGAFGMLYWAINLGFAVAAMIGGLLAGTDFFLLFLLDAGTMAAFGVIIAWKIPETRPARPPPAAGDAMARAVGVASVPGGPLRDPGFLLFIAITFLYVVIPQQSGVVLTVHMTEQGFSRAAYGAVMACNGVLIVLLQPALTAVSARRDPVRVLALAMLITGLGMALHGVSDWLVLHLLAVSIWTVGEILESPVRSTMVAAMAPVHARGRYQGGLVLTWGAAAFVSPRLGSWVWSHDSAALWGGCLGLGVLAAIAALLAAPLWRRRIAAANAE